MARMAKWNVRDKLTLLLALASLLLFYQILQNKDVIMVSQTLPGYRRITTEKQYNPEKEMKSNAEYTMKVCQSLTGTAREWFYDGVERSTQSKSWTSDTKRFSFLFTPVAKCGWTTWQVILYTDAGKLGDIQRDSRWAWDNDYHDIGLNVTTLRSVRQKVDNFKDRLVLVRNPYDRLVSAYKDKALHSDGLYTKRYSKPCAWQNMSHNMTLTFPQFVQCIIDKAAERANGDSLSSRKAGIWLDLHWTPQSHLTMPCLARYNLIGKYDRFNDNSQYLIQKLGLNASVTTQNSQHGSRRDYGSHSPSVNSQPLEFWYDQLSTNQKEALKVLYRYDFELFAFSKETPTSGAKSSSSN